MGPRAATHPIPFHRPHLVGTEIERLSQAISSGHLAGDGEFTARCQAWLTDRLGVRRALLTHSCTAALEMAALLVEVQPGDEVIMPSFTFPSTANAFLLRGAAPSFVDVRRDTLNMDEERVEAAINARTRAIVPVHYAGVACEMDAIMDIATLHRLWVVEDAALAFGASYRGRPLGTLGHLGCFSFHQTKTTTSGEGGSLVINHDTFDERAEILRDKGTNRAQFVRGEVESYGWQDIGSSFLASELIAAFLLTQLESAKTMGERRRAIADRYAEGLRPLEEQGLVRLPVVPGHCDDNAQQFHILLRDQTTRDRLIESLKEQAIEAVFHYLPLHTAPMGQSLGHRRGSLPVTEEISGRLLRLPFFVDLETGDQDRVIDAVERSLREVG